MRLLLLIISVRENVGGGAQVKSVADVCDQSGGGEGVGTEQHGQRVVAVAFRVGFKHNLKTKTRRDECNPVDTKKDFEHVSGCKLSCDT